MSNLVNLDALTAKFADYRTGTAQALRDANLLPLARLRRRQLSQLMLPLDRETAPARLHEGDYLISRKVDGEFTLLVYRDGDVVTVNPYGTVRTGADFHDEAADLFKRAGIKQAVLVGELYVRWPDGRRPRVHDVTRMARSPQSADDVGQLTFAAFGIENIDGKEFAGAAAKEVHDALTNLLGDGDRVHVVDTVFGTADDVMARFAQWVDEEGEEGVVALSDAFGWFKIKPRHTLDLAVIGFSEGIGDRTGMLHSLLLAIVRDDGTFHVVGRTGGGFSDEERVALLADLKQRVAESHYTEVNSDRVAYQMIEPGLVAEIHCLDLITASSEGEPIQRMVLNWDGLAKTWDGIRRLPLASIISPQFVRLRDDKSASPEGVGIAQLARISDVPEHTAPVEEIALPAATVLRRAVATKQLKGATMVRKLLMWKTNKETVTDEHPAYVLLLTDFSPNRKTPLERDIRVSSSLDQIETYWQAWETAKFVKGWEKVAE